MTTTSKPPFRFWSFFFSFQGRVSRVPYALTVLCPELTFISLTWLIVLAPTGFKNYEAIAIMRAMLGIFKFVWLFPTLAVTGKRLHDVGWSGWLAAVLLTPFLAAAVLIFVELQHLLSPLATPAPMEVRLTYYSALTSSVMTYGLVLVGAVLAILPGTRGSNRYGPDPLGRETVQDVF